MDNFELYFRPESFQSKMQGFLQKNVNKYIGLIVTILLLLAIILVSRKCNSKCIKEDFKNEESRLYN